MGRDMEMHVAYLVSDHADMMAHSIIQRELDAEAAYVHAYFNTTQGRLTAVLALARTHEWGQDD